MFDFAWSELALIGVVALVAIGPKDMPVAIKAVAGMVKKARRMAGEFQGHLDELMREADLGDVRNSLGELRGFNLRNQLERAIDPDGSLRNTVSGTPAGTPGDAQPVEGGAPADTLVGVRHPHMIGDPDRMAGGQMDGQIDSQMDRRIWATGGMPGYGNGYAVPPPDHLQPDPDAAPPQIPPGAVTRARALMQAPAFIPPLAADLDRAPPEAAMKPPQAAS